MPSVIGRVPNPLNGRIGLAGGRPLAERYETAKAMAIREIPEADADLRSGIFSMMISEESIDVFFDLVRQSKARHAAKDDPRLRAEWNELCRLQHDYNTVVAEIVELQKQFLWRCEHDWRHQLLRSTKADMFTAPKPVNTDWDERLYPDIPSTRAAQRKAHEMLQWAIDLRGLIGNAESFNGTDPLTQHEHLIHAAYDELTELRHSVKNLQSVTAALQAQLERKLKRKAK